MNRADQGTTPAMRIGVVAESAKTETRVALSPETVEKVVRLGYAVSVQSGAGERAGFDDAAYVEAGADVRQGTVWGADIVVTLNAPRSLTLFPGHLP